MGVPGGGIDSTFRNDIKDVSTFFAKYETNYKIFNLTGDKYDYKLFNDQVIDKYWWPDHHPPPMKLYLQLITEIDHWLSLSPKNIVAVHCLAGRSRTGTIICGYMLYSGLANTAEKAIKYFNRIRSADGGNVVLPSQIRYVKWLEHILRHQLIYLSVQPPKIKLKKIIVKPMFGVERGKGNSKNFRAWSPVIYFEDAAEAKGLNEEKRKILLISSNFQTVFMKDGHILNHSSEPGAFHVEIDLCGDVEIRFYHKSRDIKKFKKSLDSLHNPMTRLQILASSDPRNIQVPLFRYLFHTSMIQQSSCIVTRAELDAPFAGPLIHNDVIPQNLTVEFQFELETPKTQNTTQTNNSTQPEPQFRSCPYGEPIYFST
eukprot:TRINITY_DN1479_c0_g1_i1.p1 TRINITY_DN1479_c0_g1~~TRINITY_DN1479_c0_g1_i1.p1  ORF type:complete len:423 (-),score=58.44 TRINITY_DN1479_c0_g1_i1:1248-2363(-)